MTHSVKSESAQSAHIQTAMATAFAKFTPAELTEYIGELNAIILEQSDDDGTPVFEAETLLEFAQKGSVLATLICALAQAHGIPCTELQTQSKEPQD